MVCTGLRLDIGSWKIMEMSRPRIERASRPRGSSRAMSTMPLRADGAAAPWSRISPRTMRPGRGTIWRIERAVTLLPLPLSPTTQRVLPRFRVKLASSTALMTPKPVSNQVLRFLTSSSVSAGGISGVGVSGAGLSIAASAMAIGIGGVAQPVADKVERENGDDHGDARREEPGRRGDGADVLRLLQQHAPADDGRLQPEAEEAQRRLRQDHAGNGEADLGDDVA